MLSVAAIFGGDMSALQKVVAHREQDDMRALLVGICTSTLVSFRGKVLVGHFPPASTILVNPSSIDHVDSGPALHRVCGGSEPISKRSQIDTEPI